MDCHQEKRGGEVRRGEEGRYEWREEGKEEGDERRRSGVMRRRRGEEK